MRWIFPARLPDMRDFGRPIHDGDTLWLETDRGTREKTLMDIRLSDVRAPELGEPGGTEVTNWVYDWFKVRDLGQPWPFYVETFKTRSGADKKTLDRYLGVVYDFDPHDMLSKVPHIMPATGSCLNLDLVEWLKEHPGWGPGRLRRDGVASNAELVGDA